MSIRSKVWLLIAALSLVATAAKSDGIGSFQQGQSIFGGMSSQIGVAAPAGYAGPGDVIPGAVAWVSPAFGYNAADTSPAAKACLPGDTVCADLPLVKGAATIPASLSACDNSSNVCSYEEFYDKTGNGNNFIQTDPTLRFKLVVPGSGNTCPQGLSICWKATATTQIYTISGFHGNADIPQPFTISTFSNPTAIPNTHANIFDATDAGGSTATGVTIHADGVSIFCGAYSAQIPVYLNTTVWHSASGICNGTNSVIQLDAVPTTGQNIGSQVFFAAHANIGTDQFSQAFIGSGAEVGIWGSALSTTQLAALNANQQARYNPGAFAHDGPALALLPNSVSMLHVGSVDWLAWYGWQSVGGTFQAVPRVSTYNEATKKWVNPVTIGSGGNTAAGGDYHGAPACVVDGAGYMYCGFGAHSSALQMVATTAPNDPTSFVSIGTFGTNVTGAALFYIPSVNKIFMFYGTQGNATNNQSAEAMVSCTPSAGSCTFSAPKLIFDVGNGGGAWQAGGAITTDGSKIYFVTNYNTLITGGQWLAAYVYVFDPATGNVGNFAGTDTVVPASQPLGPVSYLNSTPGYLVATSTNFSQSNISVSGGSANVLLTDYSSGAVLKYSTNSGTTWTSPQTITTNMVSAVGSGLACTRTNGSGNLEAYFSDNSASVSRSILSGGTWSAPTTILAQQSAITVIGTVNCILNGDDAAALVIGENSSDGSTIRGSLRSYLYGTSGFIGNPAGL